MLAGVPGRSVFDLLTGDFPAFDGGAQFVRESLSLIHSHQRIRKLCD